MASAWVRRTWSGITFQEGWRGQNLTVPDLQTLQER